MANLTFVAPFFIVADLKASVAFYTEKLGFVTQYAGPDDDPFWAMVGRDQVSIMLKAIAPDIKPVPNSSRHRWARWDAYISASDPDALFREYRTGGTRSFHR